MTLPAGVRAVVLDIEGTTTPIAFVHETLFPHARESLELFLERRGTDDRIARAVQSLEEEHAREAQSGESVPPFGNGAPYARYLMDCDRKSTGLKLLQGVIWEVGYRDGTLRSDVFPDVPRALEAWVDAGVRVRIYSSGSVLAQRNLFGHTQYGDLSRFIEGWHDTTTGAKQDSASYVAIARALELAPGSVLFLSDSVAELDAARKAGFRTGLLERPGNLPVASDVDHPRYLDFDPLLP